MTFGTVLKVYNVEKEEVLVGTYYNILMNFDYWATTHNNNYVLSSVNISIKPFM